VNPADLGSRTVFIKLKCEQVMEGTRRGNPVFWRAREFEGVVREWSMEKLTVSTWDCDVMGPCLFEITGALARIDPGMLGKNRPQRE
jgi:hypothetical protein